MTALGQNALYAIDKPLPVPPAQPGRPSPGPAVAPADFNGRYTLIANGQTSGALEIAVDAAGAVTGSVPIGSQRQPSTPSRERSPPTCPAGSSSRSSSRAPEQVFDGLLWTEEKNVFAGTVQILEHPYSFVAVREGASLLPEAIDATSPPRAPSASKATTRVVTIEAANDRYTLDGVSKSAEELSAALSSVVKNRSPTEVLLRVPPTMPFERVQRATQLIRESGVSTIRLAQTPPSDRTIIATE